MSTPRPAARPPELGALRAWWRRFAQSRDWRPDPLWRAACWEAAAREADRAGAAPHYADSYRRQAVAILADAHRETKGAA